MIGNLLALLCIAFYFFWYSYWLTGYRFYYRDASTVRILSECALLNLMLGAATGWLLHG
ncbi:hypothetical protein L861_17585 [Litchfieldella anticariensis FP35 = DSM 16096]|uniref:Uncharacterized protein n=1 Tax=Litchfieldella anticariensis (strain DSM 16096 / CECT 5854 / CIP 108499 / LMG 22089 / FP35) TaxID=1121939 RepID=S2L6G5_LITA3|nr:hypothetical protein L861_17585 [Halomonas anticariensis FP35 = DSM 16096]